MAVLFEWSSGPLPPVVGATQLVVLDDVVGAPAPSIRWDPGSTAASWSLTLPSTTADASTRFYFRAPVSPPSALKRIALFAGGGAVWLTPSILRVRLHTTSAAYQNVNLVAGEWYRVEFNRVSGTLRARMSDAAGTLLSDTSAAATASSGVNFGTNVSSAATTSPFWLDNLLVTDTGDDIGPVVVPVVRTSTGTARAAVAASAVTATRRRSVAGAVAVAAAAATSRAVRRTVAAASAVATAAGVTRTARRATGTARAVASAAGQTSVKPLEVRSSTGTAALAAGAGGTSSTRRRAPAVYVDLGPGPRENLFHRAGINTLALSSTILSLSTYRGYTIPVVPGEVYSIRRGAATNNRFRYVFTAGVPVAGTPYFGGTGNSGSYDAALAIENMVVPPGAAYMLVYLSNRADPIPDIILERAPSAGAYFDGDTPGARWTGEPGASTSVYDGPGWHAIGPAPALAAVATARGAAVSRTVRAVVATAAAGAAAAGVTASRRVAAAASAVARAGGAAVTSTTRRTTAAAAAVATATGVTRTRRLVAGVARAIARLSAITVNPRPPRDIELTVDGPHGHAMAVSGPVGRRLDVDGPHGHPFTITGPRR